jgi:O-antigen/teichoic acid export membrane protein
MSAESKLTFFRQSGWMVSATTFAGVFMSAVHPILQKPVPATGGGAVGDWLRASVNDPITASEYGVFYTLLLLLGWIGIPAAGLQTVFAQQAALAVDEAHERELKGSVRAVLLGATLLWLVLAGGVLLLQQQVLGALKLSDAAALWVTVFCGLLVLWQPVVTGVMQGRQDFLWLGWTAVLNAVGRCAAVLVLVRLLELHAMGALLAVLAGAAVVLGIGTWRIAGLFSGPRAPFAWRVWLARLVPLTVGLGVSTFMFAADQIIVKAKFTEAESGFYGAAGVVARAVVAFTGPLTVVLFPKIVRSAARSERTDVMFYALGATALLGAVAALGCTLLPELPIRILHNATYVSVAPLVPWFAWCILPLTLANVLISNLLARQRFAAVPWLVAVAVGYWVALNLFHASFLSVVRTLGAFSLLLLAVAAWFTWRGARHGRSGEELRLRH